MEFRRVRKNAIPASKEIRRSDPGKNQYDQIKDVGGNVTTYVDEGLTPGAIYSYRVKAYRGKLDSGYFRASGYSNEASATTF